MAIASIAPPIYVSEVLKRYIWLRVIVVWPRQELRMLWLA